MPQSTGRARLFEEIRRIPEDRLAEVLVILQEYRRSIEDGSVNDSAVMQYAGAWKDMPAEEFDGFLADVSSRRRSAFSARNSRYFARIDDLVVEDWTMDEGDLT